MPRKTLRVPLATEFLNRDATLTKDSRLINCYVEKYYDGRTAIIKRPGLLSSQELGNQLGQGIISHGDTLISVAGNTVYNSKLVGGSQSIDTNNEIVYFEKISLPLDPFTPTTPNYSLPVVSTDPLSATLSISSSSRISIDKLPVNTTASDGLSISVTAKEYLLIKGNRAAYYWNGYDNKLTQILDNNYPKFTVAGIVQLDGYIFVMDQDGVIYNSNLQDHTTWNSLNFIQAEVEPDGGVAIVKHLNYLVAFGKWSMEFFYDAANPLGSPLARIDNAFSPIGCANGNSVVAMDTSVIWVSQTKEDAGKTGRGREVTLLTGMSPKKISTPFIDRILANDTMENVRALSLKNNGHDFYILTLVDSRITIVYDVTMGIWVQWTGFPLMAYFLSLSCSIGRTILKTQNMEDKEIFIGGSNTGSYSQLQLVNNKYITVIQPDSQFNIPGGNTSVYVYNLNLNLMKKIPITGSFDDYTPRLYAQVQYTNEYAYFYTYSNSVYKINITTGEYSVIPITIPGSVVRRISPVEKITEKYLVAEVLETDSSVSVYRVDITTTPITSILVTNIPAANNILTTYSTAGAYITASFSLCIPFKDAGKLKLYVYNLSTLALASTTILSNSDASTIINMDITTGYLYFLDAALNKICVFLVSNLSFITQAIPPSVTYTTDFVLYDASTHQVNTYAYIEHYVYNLSGTLLTSNTNLLDSVGDIPVNNGFIFNGETFYSPIAHTSLDGVDYLLDYGSGTVWTTDEVTYKDGLYNINVHIITPNIDIGTNKPKFTSELEIIGDKVDGTLQVSYSKDDYVSWIPYRNITLSNDRAKIHRLGKYRRSAFEFYYTENTPLRLEAFDLTIDGGED